MNEILLVHLMLGLSLWPAVIILKLFPPKKINKFYGFRTRRSMKDPKLWEAGNRIAADMIFAAAILTNLVQLASYFIMSGVASVLTTTIFMTVAVLATIPLTNRKLKQMDETMNKSMK